jgi:hypothetical protein
MRKYSLYAYYCLVNKETNRKSWYHDIIQFIISYEYLPYANKMDRKILWRLAMDYYLDGELLYKKGFNILYLDV